MIPLDPRALRALQHSALDAELERLATTIERRRARFAPARAAWSWLQGSAADTLADLGMAPERMRVVQARAAWVIAALTLALCTGVGGYVAGVLSESGTALSAYQAERDAWALLDATMVRCEQAVDLVRETDARLVERSFLLPVEAQP